jgi:hypothetical protein
MARERCPKSGFLNGEKNDAGARSKRGEAERSGEERGEKKKRKGRVQPDGQTASQR